MAAVPGSIVPLAIGQPAQLNQPVRPGENDLSDDSPVEESMDAPADQMDSADFLSTPSADTLSEPPETPVLPLEPAS